MENRKQLKRQGKKVLKQHYWLFVIVCLIAAFIGVEFGSLKNTFTQGNDLQTNLTGEVQTDGASGLTGGTQIQNNFYQILDDLTTGNIQVGKSMADQKKEEYILHSKENQGSVLGRSRGVLSMIVNDITSGSLLVSLAVAINSIVKSKNMASFLLVLLVICGMLAYFIFVFNMYRLVMRRMFLEARCYKKVYAQRALFFLKVKKWFHTSLTLFLVDVRYILWCFTIVGGVVKRYSYRMTPYIISENPSITASQAVRLSREMMDGHKWECFVLDVSFLGWNILGFLSAGLVNIFYTNPYYISTYCEYYVSLRKKAIDGGITYSELLCDRYLYEHADENLLNQTYSDVIVESQKPITMIHNLTGIRKVLADVFGLTIWNSKEEKAFEEDQSRMIRIAYWKEAVEENTYPTRLNPIPEVEKRAWVSGMNYIRHYSIWSIIMMFFLLSFVGWLWEVSLHLISDGVFVNRGVMHGPWLPIYGSGGVLILVLLNKFRKKPGLEFITTVILCGCVEYFSSYYLEVAHNGKKWWDYTGYFLNLNGRICAEGLLTFGLGGMAIVYILAPVLDNLIKRIPFKELILLNVLLICLFVTDQTYSRKHPNEGAGITDYTGACIESPRSSYHI